MLDILYSLLPKYVQLFLSVYIILLAPAFSSHLKKRVEIRFRNNDGLKEYIEVISNVALDWSLIISVFTTISGAIISVLFINKVLFRVILCLLVVLSVPLILYIFKEDIGYFSETASSKIRYRGKPLKKSWIVRFVLLFVIFLIAMFILLDTIFFSQRELLKLSH